MLLKWPEWAPLCHRIAGESNLQSCVTDMSQSLKIEFITYQTCLGDVGDKPGANCEPVIKSTLPAEWLRRYRARNYARLDPLMQDGPYNTTSRFWSDRDWSSPELAAFNRDAEKFNIPNSGYLIPLKDQQEYPAIMTFSCRDNNVIWSEKIAILAPVLEHCSRLLHMKAIAELNNMEMALQPLSRREMQCMSWLAQGKDAGSIAIILGLSEHTVRGYCRSAKLKLGCSTLYQAIHRATLWHVLDLHIS